MEKTFRLEVQRFLQSKGFKVHLCTDSRYCRGDKGMQDVVATNGKKVLFLEIKTDSKRSKVSKEQQEWLDLVESADEIESDVIRPKEFEQWKTEVTVGFSQQDIIRFWSKVDRDICWEWNAGVDRNGYGLFSIKKTSLKSHRFSYMLSNGNIPEGMLVLHRCDNPPCVNPNHLFLGTDKDNAVDRDKKGRGSKGSGLPQSVLTEQDIPVIRERLANGDSQSSIGNDYGVAPATISAIKCGKTWIHVK